MTLGEKIVSLRNGRKLSQEALAAALQVSRQSVSKWETDASIPELDKLIQLSDFFGISLDALVREDEPGQSAQEAAPEESAPVRSVQEAVPAQKHTIQRVVGYILLAVGLISCLLTLFSGIFLVFGLWLLVCCVICLAVRKYAWLVIGWFSFLSGTALMRVMTGGRLISFHHSHAGGGTRIIDIFAVILLAGLAVLTVCTVRAVRESRKAAKP